MNVAQLVVQLSDDVPATRCQAAEQLAKLDDGAKAAAAALVEAAGDENEEVREWVASALEDLGPPPAEQSDALIRLLDHPHPDVGYWAATLLGRLGSEAEPAVSKLAEVLAGQAAAEVRTRCAWALGQIGVAEGASAALRQAASESHPRLARTARQAVDRIAGESSDTPSN